MGQVLRGTGIRLLQMSHGMVAPAGRTLLRDHHTRTGGDHTMHAISEQRREKGQGAT